MADDTNNADDDRPVKPLHLDSVQEEDLTDEQRLERVRMDLDDYWTGKGYRSRYRD